MLVKKTTFIVRLSFTRIIAPVHKQMILFR